MKTLEELDARWRRDPNQARMGGWQRCVVGLFLLLTYVAWAQGQNGQQTGQPQSNGSTPAQDPGPGRAWTTNPQIVIPEAQSGARNLQAANAERRKQLTEDSVRLVKMATELKAEVYKTTKDTLSLNVIRKADEIEKLAHAVKEKMKLAPASN